MGVNQVLVVDRHGAAVATPGLAVRLALQADWEGRLRSL
jgi:hypothetical protein